MCVYIMHGYKYIHICWTRMEGIPRQNSLDEGRLARADERPAAGEK